jgi:alginate O-acetyltransferase complex protein AlgI
VLFNGFPFLLFYLAVLAVYHRGPRSWPGRKRWLLIASWFFYGSWSPGFLGLLIATTWLDFQLARWIYRLRNESSARRPGAARAALALSVGMNLGVLAFFKYGRFLYEQVDQLLAIGPPPTFLAVVAPLGVSFYTFHSISYVVDTYRGDRPPTDSFLDFALYVAFFPQLIAGPITRWGFFGPQLDAPRAVTSADADAAGFLLVRGFLKKVVCADSLGGFVDHVYADLARASSPEIALACYAYAFQIYFDFSGYTDIAKGLARLLGFRLPENFDLPYLATGPRDFWRRWHISLSTWLRDYLYIGLGGNRRGTTRTYLNLLVTMLLGGLWHGAAWHFVVWGGLHGVWLALDRALAVRTGGHAATPVWLRRLVTFHIVTALWVVFRAPSLAVVGDVAGGLLASRPMSGPFPLGPLLLALLGVVTHLLGGARTRAVLWPRLPRPVQGAAYGLTIVLVGLFSAQSERFIYFQF